jgi:hypothetical protein
MADCCEHGNEHFGSMKGGEFLDLLSHYGLCFMELVIDGGLHAKLHHARLWVFVVV